MKKNYGFTLAEIMISMGIMSVATLASLKMFELDNKVSNQIDQNFSLQQLRRSIFNILHISLQPAILLRPEPTRMIILTNLSVKK